MNLQAALEQKLIVTIVKKGAARKVIKAAKVAGCEGATTLFGQGTAPPGTHTFWGIDLNPDKEVVLTMVAGDAIEPTFTAIRRIMKLHKPGAGISMILDVLNIAGCAHLGKEIINSKETQETEAMSQSEQYDLIVTIVNSSFSGAVVEASREAGAEGGTVLHGRGSGIHEKSSLFSIDIEPEKDIVLTLVSRDISEKVLNKIVENTGLNDPGKGIAFMLGVEQVAGISHLKKLKNKAK